MRRNKQSVEGRLGEAVVSAVRIGDRSGGELVRIDVIERGHIDETEPTVGVIPPDAERAYAASLTKPKV
jgi:hypothetical protein